MASAESGHLRAVMGTVQAGRVLRNGIQAELPNDVPSLTAFLVLNRLAGIKGLIPQENLADITISKANTTEVTKGLASNGLADKITDPTDGRYKLVGITPDGREVLESMAPVIDEAAASLVRKLGDEEVRGLGQLTTTFLEKSGQALWLPHAAS